MPSLILASTSPRRKQLLALTGWDFETRPVNIDEAPLPGEDPGKYVLRLAAAKARQAGSLAEMGQVVLASDTTVADGSTILGKPVDSTDAVEILKRLRGRTHQVYTALVLFDPAAGRMLSDLCISQVPMRAYSDAEIGAYVASGDPLDKAGAYAIQHPVFNPVEHFGGCFASVMGLPLCHLVRTAQKMGLASPLRRVPDGCQSGLAYACPVYPSVLRGENVG
jgi:septum formation protein